MGRLGEKMGAVEEWYESERSRLGSEKIRMEHEKKVADVQGGSKTLGEKVWSAATLGIG